MKTLRGDEIVPLTNVVGELGVGKTLSLAFLLRFLA